MVMQAYRRQTAASTGNASKVTLGPGGASAPCPHGVQLKAGLGNTGNVFVSLNSAITTGTAVATDGFPLDAGETLFIPPGAFPGNVIPDANLIYAAGDTNSQDVYLLVL
jgi:hypothetical protein